MGWLGSEVGAMSFSKMNTEDYVYHLIYGARTYNKETGGSVDLISFESANANEDVVFKTSLFGGELTLSYSEGDPLSGIYYLKIDGRPTGKFKFENIYSSTDATLTLYKGNSDEIRYRIIIDNSGKE